MAVRVEVHVEDDGDEVTVSIESTRLTQHATEQTVVALLVDRAAAAAREAVLSAPSATSTFGTEKVMGPRDED